MTNFNIEDDIDEVDSTHATIAADDIHYIETSNEWTRWREDLAEEIFSDWELLTTWQVHRDYLRKIGLKRKRQVECLVELVNAGGWRFDTETFRPRYLNQLARMMAFKIPSSNSHPMAKGLLNKLFPHYEELSYVFGKDRATRDRAKTFAEVGSNDPAGYEAFAADTALDTDFKPMYSQGLNMSPDELMGTRTAWVSEDASQTRQEIAKKLEAIPELTLMDRCHLMRILMNNLTALLNGLSYDVKTQAKHVRGCLTLEAIPELTLMDRCRLMRILMHNIDDMKDFLDVPDNMKYPYCNIIFQENR
ncbi:retrotransposon protein [Cucumis melo var. makuwa]|uniref:Retrotransposon protein n=1 Tax=Cucumis melo var. makuwa TaxID=1194695 RepID=A0A5D3E3R2_CUCMM|nr:retrotransposon protein [Cucumis melo var. makuwa]TYK30200.1 retrotransposon protein [Cucumis melo var. makuwa]